MYQRSLGKNVCYYKGVLMCMSVSLNGNTDQLLTIFAGRLLQEIFQLTGDGVSPNHRRLNEILLWQEEAKVLLQHQ